MMQSINANMRPVGLQPFRKTSHSRSVRRLVVAALDEETRIGNTKGVDALLEKDLKIKERDLDALESAFADPTDAAPSPPKTVEQTSSKQQQPQPTKNKQQERSIPQATSEFSRCRDAIDAGLAKYNQADYQAALDLFQLALELPGTGLMRMSTSPREYACASEGEENSCLYNMACCYARLGKSQAAYTVLEALLENNFDDYNTIKTDPDLASLRGSELDKLISKYDNMLAKVFGKKKETSNKPWLRW